MKYVVFVVSFLGLLTLFEHPHAASAKAPSTLTEQSNHALGDTFSAKRARQFSLPVPFSQALPRMDFIDVSSHNGDISVAQYLTMKNHGVKGVVVKLTEGSAYKNPFAKGQVENAKLAGLQVSAYNFAWFENNQEAIDEAIYFSDYAKEIGLPLETVMVNDVEHSILLNSDPTENSLLFKETLHQLGYATVVHYSSAHWFQNILDIQQLGKENAWIAQWPASPSASQLLHQDYAAWQWRSTQTFPNSEVLFDVSIDYLNLFSAHTTLSAPLIDTVSGNYREGYVITGFTEREKTVEVLDSDGKQIGSTTADADGFYTLQAAIHRLTETRSYSVRLHTPSEIGPRTSFTLDANVSNIPMPTLQKTYRTYAGQMVLQGAAQPKTTISVTNAQQQTLATTKTTASGTFSLTLSKEQTPPNETLYLLAMDIDGNESPKKAFPLPAFLPTFAPPVIANITFSATKNAFLVQGTAQKQATLRIQNTQATVLATHTVDDTETFDIHIPAQKVVPKETLQAILEAPDGTISQTTTFSLPENTTSSSQPETAETAKETAQLAAAKPVETKPIATKETTATKKTQPTTLATSLPKTGEQAAHLLQSIGYFLLSMIGLAIGFKKIN